MPHVTLPPSSAIPASSDIKVPTIPSDAKGIGEKITSRTKLVIAQHSFGIPCEIREIVELCEKHDIFVFEDSAIALDSSIGGIKVGNWGDAAMFSTDHSKPMNTIIGGFFYTKNKSLYEKVKDLSADLPQLEKTHQERLYDQFLFERKSYTPARYPRAVVTNNIRAAIKKFSSGVPPFTFLEADYKKEISPSSSYPYPAKLPPFLAQIGLFELDRWEIEKQRRRSLLEGYLNIMAELNLDKYLPGAYSNPDMDIVPLRFVFRHPDSERLMKKMARYIDVNWTWFSQPIICCPDGPESLGYPRGSCELGEETGQTIINWPCAVPENWGSRTIEIFRKVMKDGN